MKRIIKSVVVYSAQVCALWGLLEGYTYFKGDALKAFLGGYWVLIYILPLFATAYLAFQESHEGGTANENITTRGNFSPGKVGQNYSVGIDEENALGSAATGLQSLTQPEMPKLKETISTEGHYSPGKVGGSYAVRVQAEALEQATTSGENTEPSEADNTSTKSDKSIRTKGNYSPGEVGGDYKIEQR
jgi:hypothetical protein